MHRRTMNHIRTAVIVAAIAALTGCQPKPPVNTGLVPVELPTYDMRDSNALCAELDRSWGVEWARTIYDLEKLHYENGRCNNEDPALKLYPAYYNYGAALEQEGRIEDAVKMYQNALAINPSGVEAAEALKRRNVFTPMPLEKCSSDQITAALKAVPAYVPQGKAPFVRIDGTQFKIGVDPFVVHGVNYYPMRAPWKRFLPEADLRQVALEMDLIHSAGINALRIFLKYDALFQCPGNGAVPNPAGIIKLDQIIQLATERGFRLLVTLNDLPDLTVRPLYLYPQVPAMQTAYLVMRYRDEPAIFAWDLRNEGDIDYTRYGFSSFTVLDWLARTAAQVRQADPNHLLTAGWLSDAQVTDGAVDFLSFHHWSAQQSLRQRIAGFRTYTQKPILLEETGFSTLGGNEAQQSDMLRDVLTAAKLDGLAGWMVWVAFDFPTDVTCTPPACPSKDNGEHHFGLWNKDYTPKAAVELIRQMTRP
jgi:tetratricopeptide (TPR) repeat protein